MPPSKTSGLKVARKRLADGSVREYFYDRETGKFLSNDRQAALDRLKISERIPSPGTMAALVTQYKASSHYLQDLAPGTRRQYNVYLELIRREWGDLPVSGIKPGTIELIKLQFENTPRKANQILALLRVLLGRAVKWGVIPSNPALKPDMLPNPPRTAIWSREDERRFIEAARPSLRLAILLMLYTLQRPADCLNMTTNRVSERDGRLFISLRQQKTDTLLDIPVHSTLEPYLRERLSPEWTSQPLINQTQYGAMQTMLLVPSPNGRPWSFRNFARAWDQAAAEAGISGLQRRDLRRTGIVRLAEAGATTPQIAAVSGHSIDQCQRIIDTYLPRRTEVALGAIELWERAPVKETVKHLPSRRRK